MPQQILKTDDEWKTETAITRFVDYFENVDGAAILLERSRLHIAVGIDREVAAAPTVDVVSSDSSFNVPFGLHFFARSVKPQSAPSITASNMQAHAKKSCELQGRTRSRSKFLETAAAHRHSKPAQLVF